MLQKENYQKETNLNFEQKDCFHHHLKCKE